MRFWSIFMLLFVSQCTRSSTPVILSPVRDEAVTVTSVPVPLYPATPARRDLGALVFLGGWQLTGDVGWFGGLSALVADGNHLTAVTDAGGLIEFDIGRFGHISNAHILPMPARCGTGGDKIDRDSEALTYDPVSGDWWIALEGRNAICRFSSDFTTVIAKARPEAMRSWPFNFGPETLLRLDNGGFLTLSEGSLRSGNDRAMIIFDGDPTDPRARASRMTYRAPAGFSPTDATQLPDGRVLVVNRRFRPWSLFTVVLTLVDPANVRPGALISGQEIARFAPPVTTENFEGIAVTQETGRTVLWLIADNNFASWQRTLLFKFAIDPAKLP